MNGRTKARKSETINEKHPATNETEIGDGKHNDQIEKPQETSTDETNNE